MSRESGDKKVAVEGGIWMSLSTIATMLAQFLRLIILTRFLEKSDFGVVSIVNMVVGLCLAFTDLGFSSSIMYKNNVSVKEFSTLFWTQAVLYLLIYIILVIFSPVIAGFYNEKILLYLIPLAGFSIFLQSVGKLYDSILQKNYKFKILATLAIITNFTSLFIAWYLAAKGYGAYSLVYSTLYQISLLNICEFLIGIKLQKLSLNINIKETLPLIKIGFFQTGTRILDFLSYKLDVMIIGKLLGVEILGVYDLAKEIVVKFVSLISSVVSKVALPILANNNNDDEIVKARFLQITKIVAIVCIPTCICLSVFCKEIILILYGDKFVEASPIVAVFAVISMISSITCFIDMLGISKGRTDLNFKNTIYRIVITTPIVILTSLISIKAVVWGQLAISIICFIIFWKVVTMKTYPIQLKVYFAQFGKILIITSLVGIIVAFVKYMLSDIITYSIIGTLFYFILYCILLAITSYLLIREDLHYIFSLIPRKR